MGPNPGEEDTGEDFDMNSALAEVSSGLFGQDDEGGNKEGSESVREGEEGKTLPDDSTTSPPDLEAEALAKAAEEEAAAAAKNSEEVQAVGAPETWTKEAIVEWAKIPPRAQQEILKREQDIMRGIEEYKGKAEIGTQYDNVVEPYRAALAAENINPVELFQSFAGNHYLLSRGTPEQKLAIAANLITHYGIPLDQLVERAGSVPRSDPAVAELRQQLASLQTAQQQREAQESEQRMEQMRSQVDTFFKDPKNVYAQELSNDIAELLKTKACSTLEQAYETAMYRNPSVRQKEIDRLKSEQISLATQEEAARVQAANAAKGANVKQSQKTRDGAVPVGTMDDTLNDTMAKIAARGG